MPDERDMVGSHRPAEELHICFIRCAVTLAIITLYARRHEVLPRVFTQPGLRDDMIHGEGYVVAPAVLTVMAIPAQNILPGKNDFFVRNPDIHAESDDARKRHGHRHGANFSSVVSFNQLRFTEVEKDNRLFDIADTQRLIVLVQDEHFTAELTV